MYTGKRVPIFMGRRHLPGSIWGVGGGGYFPLTVSYGPRGGTPAKINLGYPYRSALIRKIDLLAMGNQGHLSGSIEV